ncbi:MAG TPA: FMN-binding protein, partial [Bacteroidia bacterium]|nr:FMN-binding protein [Bacteroidia bacterium]
AVVIRSKNVTQTPVIATTTSGKRFIVTPTVTPVPPTSAPTVQTSQPTTVVQPTLTPVPVIPTATPVPQGQYKDGTYTGSVADAFYGPIQVQVTVTGGKITNIKFLQAPNDHEQSIQINQQADPMLAQEAIETQSATVDIISGATDTSSAFIQSMQSALSQAKS